jgi:hypothetical protein
MRVKDGDGNSTGFVRSMKVGTVCVNTASIDRFVEN